MGLSSSMWTSVSGLLAHGEKMNVISNNLANVSTLGFKSQRMDFEDFLYQDTSSGSGPTQVGFGVGVNTIVTDFSQGSFESTNSATDLAINGTGFFKVTNPTTGADFYTRAGNFNFNNQGYLTMPSGEVLQGWPVDNIDTPLPATGVNPLVSEPQGIQTKGSPQDIVLDTWTILPKATTNIELSVNLMEDDEKLDKSKSTTNPLFAMSETWDGKNAIQNPGTDPISDEAYTYPAPMTVYDEGGTAHQLTCYFDQVPKEVVADLPTGYTVYEYMLTMDPSEDARTFGGTYDPATGVLTGASSFQDTEAAGILMKGTMIFNSSGQLVSQTAYSYMGNVDSVTPGATAPGTLADPTSYGHPDNPESWQPTPVSDSGYPVFTANFSGHPMGNFVGQSKPDGDTTKSKESDDILIEFNLGLQSENPVDPWAMGGNPANKPDKSGLTAAGGGTSLATVIAAAPSYANLATLVPSETESGSSSSIGEKATINFGSQDGYPSGSLANARIDTNGVVYGIYTNNIEMPLYQVAMYDFVNPQGLRREGGNLYSETAESGSIQLAEAGVAGMGTIQSYNIEQSNVDMSVEFVQMIVTQRGFQGNSKGITTVDTMLEQVINMKR